MSASGRWLSQLTLAVLRALSHLPLPLLAFIGWLLGGLLFLIGGSRRRIALRNLELCFPELGNAQRQRLLQDHFGWLGRSLIDRAVLWYASPARIKRLLRVEGDVHFAEQHDGAVMWLVPHFVALDAASAAGPLFQSRRIVAVYQRQSNPVFDAAFHAGRLRHGGGEAHSRHQGTLPLVRSIKRGAVFMNLPDMDFGRKDAAFVPFFGIQAATLLAPARMARSLNMVVQPVVAETLPRGQGWRIRYLPPWTDFPGDDECADMARVNAWIESEVRRLPAQYLWVHRRFKTRPEGESSLYTSR